MWSCQQSIAPSFTSDCFVITKTIILFYSLHCSSCNSKNPRKMHLQVFFCKAFAYSDNHLCKYYHKRTACWCKTGIVAFTTSLFHRLCLCALLYTDLLFGSNPTAFIHITSPAFVWWEYTWKYRVKVVPLSYFANDTLS